MFFTFKQKTEVNWLNQSDAWNFAETSPQRKVTWILIHSCSSAVYLQQFRSMGCFWIRQTAYSSILELGLYHCTCWASSCDDVSLIIISIPSELYYVIFIFVIDRLAWDVRERVIVIKLAINKSWGFAQQDYCLLFS